MLINVKNMLKTYVKNMRVFNMPTLIVQRRLETCTSSLKSLAYVRFQELFTALISS